MTARDEQGRDEQGGGERRTAVLILGMHRGGGSVLAGLIAALGATPPRDSSPPTPDNPEGFWEPAGIVRLHDRMLHAAGSAWLDTRPLDLAVLGEERLRSFAAQLRAALDASFGPSLRFVLKDPRICRMIPFYRDLLGEMGVAVKVVIASREPADVAASLLTRNQMSPDYAGFLWARHLLDAERETRELPRMIVPYEALMADWRIAAERLGGFLGTEARALDPHRFASPVRPDLHHHRSTPWSMFSQPLGDLLQDLGTAFAGLAGDGSAGGAASLDALGERLSRASAAVEDVLTAEFCFHRSTMPRDALAASDPVQERRGMAEALGRLHRLQWHAHASAIARETRVGLFVGGVQKCGTTSLFRYLSGHPHLQPPDAKELHFFDDETLDWRPRDGSLEDYGALHACYRDAGSGLRFDSTPIYCFWPSALERIQAYNPRAKFILVFRDPIERAYSHWRMERLRGTETLSFSDAIRGGRKRLPADDPAHVNWRNCSYVERGFYGQQIARLLSLFPREQVLTLDSSDLRHRHLAVLERIAGFLEIIPFPPFIPRLDHHAPSAPHLPPLDDRDRAFLRDLYAEDLRSFAALSGHDIGGWWATSTLPNAGVEKAVAPPPREGWTTRPAAAVPAELAWMVGDAAAKSR
jgi:hypothetical protein